MGVGDTRASKRGDGSWRVLYATFPVIRLPGGCAQKRDRAQNFGSFWQPVINQGHRGRLLILKNFEDQESLAVVRHLKFWNIQCEKHSCVTDFYSTSRETQVSCHYVMIFAYVKQ